MAKGSAFYRQMKALLWKNFLIHKRHPVKLFFQLFFPIAIIGLLSFLRSLLKVRKIDESVPNYTWYSSRFTDLYNFDEWVCEYERLLMRCAQPYGCSMNDCQLLKIAVAPRDANDMASFTASINFVSYMAEKITNYSDYNTFVKFASEDEFEQYIDQADYGAIASDVAFGGAIIFTSGYPDWAYKIRLNMSRVHVDGDYSRNVPETDIITNSYLKASDEWPDDEAPYLQEYNDAGWFSLQDEVNQYILNATCQLNAGGGAKTCASLNSDRLRVEGLVEFPYEAYNSEGFWSLLQTTYSILVVLSMTYLVSGVLGSLITEKELKLKEGMKMMALRGEVLAMSWVFNFFMMFMPLAVAITLISSVYLFKNSEIALIFAYFALFYMATISLCFFLSAFFNKAKTGVFLGILVFFGGIFITVGIDPTQQSKSAILAASLHPSAAFAFGTLAFIEYEDPEIGVNFDNYDFSEKYHFTFRDCLTMLAFDIFWLIIATWYANEVAPSEFGSYRPWYFLLTPSYYQNLIGYKSSRKIPVSVDKEIQMTEIKTENDVTYIQPVSEMLRRQEEDKTCVQVRNLKKEFDTTTGKKVAVDGLDLDIYSNQITCLLGHNGAGKTTTISILTGLITATSGSGVIQGLDIFEDMDEIRNNLGVCPQHDVLFPDLTVREHLIMFATIKGVPKGDIDKQVDLMIQEVGLMEKRDILSAKLSGGMKRKLSLGIAYIGGSRVVFLDEPTSGMDPYSRRFTWNIIRRYREGRITVLCTHFMDEADLLGDRIAIMAAGKLRCAGTSLYLKGLFGVGYNMTVEKTEACNVESLKNLVLQTVPDSKLLTNVGSEVSFQLPFQSSGHFQTLFSTIDANEGPLGVKSYGMSVTTLEEVFINIAHGTGGSHDVNGNVMKKQGSFKGAANESKENGVTYGRLDENQSAAYFARHMRALLVKRFLLAIRDKRTWIFQVTIPLLFVAGGLIILYYTSSFFENQAPIVLNRTMFNPSVSNNDFPLPYSNATSFDAGYGPQFPTNQDQIISLIDDTVVTFPTISVDATDITAMSQYLLDNKHTYEASTYIASSFVNAGDFGYDYLVHANFTGVHSSPLAASMVAEGIVRQYDPAASISVTAHPMPFTAFQLEVYGSFDNYTLVTFISMAVAFIPAAYVYFVVREKETKSKHQQLVSGVSVIAYWLSNYVWDILSYLIFFVVTIILLNAFNPKELVGDADAFTATAALLFLYGPAIIGFTYITSFLMKTHTSAQAITIMLNLVVGLILSIVGYVLRVIPITSDLYNSTLQFIFMLFPSFCVCNGLSSLTVREFLALVEEQGSDGYKPWDDEIAGYSIKALAVESILYISLTIMIEFASGVPFIQQSFVNLWSNSKTRSMSVAEELDEDVLAEKERINRSSVNKDSVVINKFRKVFPGGKVAVKEISLGIPNGECFGLLGINGAGKTTTLSMLSGEFPPTSGDAFLGGYSVLTQIHKARRLVGYCPQFDALFDMLTGKEHLYLYGRIKGIHEKDLERVVNTKIKEMDLTEYAPRMAGSYSGGNKRKLSVAMAMIGDPPIVFLDEPSTGMDPVARRFMWDVISDIATKRALCSIILTTHSMEECEALCTRIGIMVGGKLQCLGSAQHLRTRFGLGYQLEIGFQLPSEDTLKSVSGALYRSIATESNGRDVAGMQLNMGQIKQIMNSTQNSGWISRISKEGSGSDMFGILESVGHVTMQDLAAWYITETQNDSLSKFMDENIGNDGYVLRERHHSKVRFEVKSQKSWMAVNRGMKMSVSTVGMIGGGFQVGASFSQGGDSQVWKLSELFGMIEYNKTALEISEYSLSQTSLEQIFNGFAALQDEETGAAAGIVSHQGDKHVSTKDRLAIAQTGSSL